MSQNIKTMQTVIETQNLTFNFLGKRKAVNDLQLNVPEGSIYGFLGPNGAGKSTTIRMLAGLLYPAKGKISLFGQDFRKSKSRVLRRSAFMIEEPTFYRHLSGRKNLEILGRAGNYKRNRIDEVLKTVNLFDDRNRKAGNYSMGMKQRLGIAGALLSDPELFVLDEPTNGLDPQGMYEIRELIIELNRKYGKTIFISSHLLGEIEKMCTHVGIIHHGCGKFEGTIDELASMSKSTNTFRIECNDSKAAKNLLQEKWKMSEKSGNLIDIYPEKRNDQIEIVNTLVKSGVQIMQAYEVKSNLEELFIHVTDN